MEWRWGIIKIQQKPSIKTIKKTKKCFVEKKMKKTNSNDLANRNSNKMFRMKNKIFTWNEILLDIKSPMLFCILRMARHDAGISKLPAKTNPEID